MNDDLLVKHLCGEAGEQECLQVEDWLRDEGNARYYRQLEQVWVKSNVLAPLLQSADEQAAWERFREKLQKENLQQLRPVRQKRHWMRIAAALTLLVTMGALLVYLLQRPYGMQRLHSGDEIVEATLPDGTLITLNKHSVLRYSSGFPGSRRELTLEGEAFFQVVENKAKPFVVHAGAAEVTVTGTTFNVKEENATTEVIVESGSVKVSAHGKEVALKPGELALSGKNELTKTETSGKLYQFYRTRELVCEDTPLQELVAALNEAYDVRISIPDKALRQQSITTVFKEASLDQILNVIAETFELKVQRSGKQIILAR